MKYLSLDLETTGLEDDALIIEFGAVPVDTITREIKEDTVFHSFLKCPTFEELKPNLNEFVIENNESLIREANKSGVSKESFLKAFDEYMNSKEVKDFFGDQEPIIMGKSLTALDIPLLIRDFGREDFLRKYFHHRVMDVSCAAKTAVDMGLLPEGCDSSHRLAKYFNLGEDVDHTAVADSIDVAKMYFGIIDLPKKVK